VDGIVWHRGDEGPHRQNSTGLRLQPGTVTLLMGPNGAGKTTLLEKLAGLRPPEKLNITYGTEPLWIERKLGKPKLNVKALRSYSYACQLPEEGLFARSVADEMEYSLRPFNLPAPAKEQFKKSALSSVGWNEAWLSRDPYLMSGGERRRAALSALFATPASWILLDEPTAGLDGAGHDRVAQHIRKLKSQNTGVLLVSHDSDWALPLADQVLLLNPEGSLKLCSSEQLLACPEWLEETGMQIPEWLQTAHLLWGKGIPAMQVWKPAEAARALSANAIAAAPGPGAAGQRQAAAAVTRKRPTERVVFSRVLRFDPRAVWLSYMLLSIGMFAQTAWLGIAAGAIVTASLLAAGRISLRRWRALIQNFVIFAMMVSGFLAIDWGGDHGYFNMESFLATLFSFARTMLVLLLGLGMAIVMTPLSLRKSLGQILTFKGKMPAFAQKLVLTVTLMIRFVPVLLREWERYTRIFLARGKQISRTPAASIRRLRDVSLPFLLSLFRLGDEVVLALESRGVGMRATPNNGERLRWQLRDSSLAAGSFLLAGALWWFAKR
jgi:energy-coupling factor transport system permease/ATP-binding protein